MLTYAAGGQDCLRAQASRLAVHRVCPCCAHVHERLHGNVAYRDFGCSALALTNLLPMCSLKEVAIPIPHQASKLQGTHPLDGGFAHLVPYPFWLCMHGFAAKRRVSHPSTGVMTSS